MCAVGDNHPFLIFPFWLANSANPRASMVGGHYHSHKTKKSDKKDYGMNTQYRVECTYTFLFLFRFSFLWVFPQNFSQYFLQYLISLQQFRDARQEVAYCLSNDILVFYFSMSFLYSINLHLPHPSPIHPLLFLLSLSPSPDPNVLLCLCSISEVWDERWHIVSALVHTFKNSKTFYSKTKYSTVVITSNCRQI